MRVLKNWSRAFVVGDEENIGQFALSVADQNPLHLNDRASRDAGLHGVIAPAAMIIGWASSAIADELPGVRVHRLGVTFKSPVYPGMRLDVFCSLLKQRGRSVHVEVIFRNEMKMVAKGSCKLVLPK